MRTVNFWKETTAWEVMQPSPAHSLHARIRGYSLATAGSRKPKREPSRGLASQQRAGIIDDGGVT
jgi:hypothetical protein